MLIYLCVFLLFAKFGVKSQENADSGTCTCVRYYLCDDENYIITDGSRIMDPSHCSDVESDFGVRRRKSRRPYNRLKKKYANTHKRFIKMQRSNNEDLAQHPCPSEHICCRLRTADSSSNNENDRTERKIIRPTPNLISSARCGNRLSLIVPKIIAPEASDIVLGEFPWLVAITQNALNPDGTQTQEFKCWGSMIHPKVIVTVTHCVKSVPINTLKIRTGVIHEEDVAANINVINQERKIAEVVEHANYYAGALHNDISLLILEQPLLTNEIVNPVCTPSEAITSYSSDCVAIGWKEVIGNKTVQRIMLPVIQHNTCQTLLRRSPLGPTFNLHESFLCAGGEEGRDTCVGDGGAPLVCLISGSENYVQVGITSWGVGGVCGQNNVPGAYTNLSKFSDWISSEMMKRGLQI